MMARAFRRPTFRFKLPKGPILPRLPRTDEPYEDVFEEMTLQEHLEELRDRLVKVCLSIGAAFIVGLIFSGQILEFMANQANAPQGFDVKSPTDPITIYMTIALYVAIASTLPIIIYHLVGFLAPGLTRKEKRVVYASLPFVALLTVAGAAYGFFFAARAALQFLSTFQSDIFSWEPDGGEVISFYLKLMVGLAVAFQMPLIMFLLAKLNIVSVTRMQRYRRYAFVVILILAAIITPTPDPFNLAFVALPLYLLYEGGIIIARVFARPIRTSE
jgi:sec-independent protein translocase protein TatC